MKTRMFGIAVAVASLIVLTSGRNLLAQAAPQSDELKILATTGAPLADIFIPETTGPGTQPSALFSPGLGPLVAPGTLPGTIPPPGFPGLSYVILTEPSGEPVDPNDLPPVTYPFGPNGPVVVSDLLINSAFVTSGPPFIALVSDNNPDLERYVSGIPVGTAVPVLPETGALQDLTGPIGPTPGFGQITVGVQSDVTTVPEPSTLALVILGAVPMLIARRRLSVR